MITITQKCTRCGQERTLGTDLNRTEPPNSGGWRSLDYGAREITLCNTCVRAIVYQTLNIEGTET